MISLEQALSELPDTADEIARMLIEADCQGRMRNGKCCPMANYLTRLGFVEPFVQPDYVQVNGAMPPTSSALEDFVERFDEGEWPELVSDREADEREDTDA